MAGSCDRNPRVGGKSRGTRSQFRLEDLQPFKSVYPLHLTDMMDAGLSTQTGPQSGSTSPYKETRTLAVREYETTLDQLRRENFDLKLKLFLTEKERNKQYQTNNDSSCETDNTLQVSVNLKVETEKLRNDLIARDEELQAALDKIEKFELEISEKDQAVQNALEKVERYQIELRKKDQALKDALENVEKFTVDLNEKEQALLNTEELAKKYELESKELQSKIEELKAIFKQYPTTGEVLEIKEQLSLLSSTNEYLNKTLDEKVNELEESNSKLAKLAAEKAELEHKLHLRNITIQGCCKRYNEDIGMPSEIREFVKDAIAAAKDANKTDVLFNIENLKSSLFGLMPESSKENISSSDLGGSQKQGSSQERKSKKLQEKIDSRSSRSDSNHGENDISMKDLAIQTDLQWNLIESKLSDKQAQTFGVSDDVEELREEVLMLLLAFEQKEKELQDSIRKLEFLHSDEENTAVKDTDTLAPDAEDFAAERTDLQRRLAISCSVNNELMKYLKSLEKFMEDLLYQKNLSTSSFENLNETSEFFSELSKCLDQSLKLSQVLSDQLSICEGSKIFDPNDVTLTKEEINLSDLKSYEFDPESRFSQTESDLLSVTQEGMNKFHQSSKDSFKNSFKTGKRRLSFSSEQRVATEADNVVVLKTGNNEDVILVLNSNGDPEDVLIRNSGSFADKIIDGDQFRRRCWDTAMNDPAWNAEKFSIAHYKENLFNFDQVDSVKPSSVRYNSWMSSDSDTWSEPDRNVSLQRIGIDIQTSPVTSKSPRRSRLKDRRLSDDSTKNESATSYVKLHSWSKRRRCSDTSKISFVCKKCRKPYIQFDDVTPENVSITQNQEVQDLYNTNAKQQKELENLQRMLVNKENLLESLKTEKHGLQSEINALKDELKVLMNNNDALSLQNKTFSNKLTKEISENNELSDIMRDLKKKSAESDVICDELRLELNQTKERLLKLQESCSNYVAELSSCKQISIKQENEIVVLKQNETELLKEIKELTSQKNGLLDSLSKEKERKNDLESKNLELNMKLKEGYTEMERLKSAEKDFMDLKKTLIEQKQTAEEKLANSDSLCKDLKLEVKTLTDSLHSLKAKYEAYESETQLLFANEQYIKESLQAFKLEFIANLNILSDLCNETIELKSESFENIQNILLTKKCDDEQINKLLNEITCENLKLKKFSKSIRQKLQDTDTQNRESKVALDEEQNKLNSLKQEVKLKDSEIESLKTNLSKLQESVEELKSTIMKYDYTEEIQKHQLSDALQKLNEKKEQVATLIEENKYWQNNFSMLQDQLSKSEKSISSKLSETVQKLNEKEENVKTLIDKNNKLENSLHLLQKKLSNFEKSSSLQISNTSEKLAEEKEQVKTLIDNNNHLQNTLTVTQEKLANSEKSNSLQLSDMAKKLREKDEQVKVLMDKNNHLQDGLNMLQNQLKKSEKSISTQSSDTLQQLDGKEEEVRILIEENNQLHNSLNLLQSQLSNTENLYSVKLSQALQKLSEKEELLKNLIDENNHLENNLHKFKKKLSNFEKSDSFHKSDTPEQLAEREQIKTLVDKNNYLQNSLNITQKQLDNSEKSSSLEMSDIAQKLDKNDEQMKVIIDNNSQLQNSLNVLQRQLNDSDKSISSQLFEALEQLSEMEEKVKDLSDENYHLRNNANSLQNQLSNSEKSVSMQISDALKNLSEKEEQVKTLNDKNNYLQNSLNMLQKQFDNSEKSSSLKLSNMLQKLNEKEEQIKVLIAKNNQLQNNLNLSKNQLTDSEKSISIQLSETLQLGEKEEKIKTLMIEKSDSLQVSADTLQKSSIKEEEVKTLMEEKNNLKNNLTVLQKQFANSEASIPFENAPSKDQFTSLEKTVEKDKILLDSKNKEINALQERIVALQEQIAKLLDEKINRRDSSSSSEVINKADNVDAQITSSEKSSHHDSSSHIPVSSKATKCNQEVSSTSVQKKEHDKCIRKIKSLQSKLEIAEKCIENLEKEKANLRENLLAYVHQTKQTSLSNKDFNAKNAEVAELLSKLKTKQLFIEELKSDLYKAHDSLIDKQKEIDKVQLELTKYEEIAKGNSKPSHENIPSDKMSDIFLENTENSISDLRERKRELIDSLLELQKQFYESKNIPLKHFDKFFSHIESLRNLQVHPTLVKSESVPAVNTFSSSSLDESKKWDRSLKNTKIDLEVDIECLQNFRLFLKRFFTPLMLQINNKKDEYTQTIAQDYSKSEEVTKSTIAGIEHLLSTVGSSHDRLTSTASSISQKLDCMESDLKGVFEDFSHIYPMNETSRIAVPILQKISERICSLQDNFDEIFKFMSILKSLELFENTTPHNISKQDMSDQESLLSEETITLSRSESLSPVSFDSRFRSNSQQQEAEMQDSNQSYPKQLEESRRVPLRPFHRLLSSSQDSVFQRSHYSSPDLGIESDPNHEHSAPEGAEKAHAVKIFNSKTELSTSDIHKLLQSERPSIFSLSSSSLMLKDVSMPITISDTLHAIGILQEYELLKKEVAESLVGIKSVLARTGDGLHHIASYTSPRKKLEYSTFKAIKDTCLNIEVCLQKAHKLIQNFWVAPCPSEEELKMFLRQNEELNAKLKRLYESKKKQEKDFKDVIEKLKQAELIKEQQEQKISKRLVKTKKVLRLAEKKLLETKNMEFPFMTKHSSKLKQ